MYRFQKHANVVDILSSHACGKGDDTALVLYGQGPPKAVSYAELLGGAVRVAGLLRRKYPPGSRVLLANSEPGDFATSFLGCLFAGIIAVPAPVPSGRHHERRLRRIAEHADVVAALTTASDLRTIERWASRYGSTLPVLNAADAPVGAKSGPLQPALHKIALLQYTSGSTGAPKGVVVTHENLITNVASLCRGFRLDASVRFGGWIPLYHDMGLIALLLPALFLGSTCTLMPQASFIAQPLRWLRMMDDCGVNYSAAPNFAFDFCVRLAEARDLSDLDLSRWTHAINGSEPIRTRTLARFAECFAAAGFRPEAFLPSYGLAEATVYVSGGGTSGPMTVSVDADALARHVFRSPRPGNRTAVLTGSGVPADLEVAVVDPATHLPRPPGQVGELWLRGEGLATGYWDDEQATKGVFRAETADGQGPYLRTGDLGVVHEGVVFVTGRLKDVLVVRGRNLYPQDIEEELRRQHPALASSVGVAFTVPVSDDAEDPSAIVIAYELRHTATEDECARLAEEMRLTVTREFGISPGGIALLPRQTVQRTTSGKIERRTMRARFLSGELTAVYEDLDMSVAAARSEGSR
ncbi:fatty acyl-AMP ligase [Allokutzneria sp. A3M-2-11 16]|uniref:fatty acyl-AMP ligase n=1 Tax=Allokutzneria sp. A3M-2-11 16 TaxID=2962043 RepID=UPI0020B7AF9F|nr:fatty acyl-AMP ligase [Allokutzneria sp. A3M-2-11 16]MCP3801991.1 fatty acyl-AMP ligase [Allokutzneria sp. A3M-2-11 16]